MKDSGTKNISNGNDIFTTEKRSQIMAKIGPSDTKPEVLLRKRLHQAGFRFRKNVKKLPGKPDIVLSKYKTAILIHGCFWHRHNCKRGQSMPSTRYDFWKEKFAKNVTRDAHQLDELKKMGWQVLIVWECELKYIEETIKRIISVLTPSSPAPPAPKTSP